MPRTKEQYKKYNESEKGKMRMIIHNWKRRGLKVDTPEDYYTIYYHWLVTTNCEKCNKEFTISNVKCMDHNHITGEYRNILCHNCNTNDKITNTSGTPNIYWDKARHKWHYQKRINGKKHNKRFITKEEAIAYKIQYESGEV